MANVAAMLLAGYEPKDPEWPVIEQLNEGSLDPFTLDCVPEACGERGLTLVLASYIDRGRLEQQLPAMRQYFGQLAALAASEPSLPLTGIVVMQRKPGQKAEALRRLEAIRHLMPSTVNILLLSIVAQRKMMSLNCMIAIANRARARAVGWIDDDIVLSDGALTALWRELAAAGYRGAVGPRKIGRPMKNVSSRVVFGFKSVTAPATNYPHGCCLLVDAAVVGRGIPWKYASDDGFVCFELLRPEASDPMHLLRICESATCYHDVGAPTFRANWTRVRRMQLNHLIMMASYPTAVGRYYFRNILFPGLWPIGGRSDAPPWRGLLKWSFKLIHFLVFLSVAIELIVRGWLGRPLGGIVWGGSNTYGDART